MLKLLTEPWFTVSYKRQFKIFFANNAQDAHTDEKKSVICLFTWGAFIQHLVY